MMFPRWRPVVSVCVAAGALFVAACGEEAPQPPARAPQAAPPPSPAQAPASVAPAETPAAGEVTAETAKPPQYSYDESLRDPFIPAATLSPVEDGGVDCGPLCQYDVAQFRISGIIWGIAQPAAMLQAPDGKPYIVKVGSPIGRNKGKVVSITKKRIAVLEKYVNYRGEVVTNRVDIELPEEGGSLK